MTIACNDHNLHPTVQIEFKDVKMRYRPGLPLVLKGLNVNIEAGTTCGVVGRTGGLLPLLLLLLVLLQHRRASTSVQAAIRPLTGLSVHAEATFTHGVGVFA